MVQGQLSARGGSRLKGTSKSWKPQKRDGSCGEADLEQAEGPFLESQDISSVAGQQHMGRQCVADPLVAVLVKRREISSSTPCVV